MHTVGCPRQRGPRPQHIKGLPGTESRARAGGLFAGALFAGVRRARRVPRAGEAAGVPVVVRQIVVLPGRPAPREHRFNDQIKDLFLAKVTRAGIIRPGAAACSGGTVRAGAAASRGGTATASAGPTAAAVTRRPAVPGTPGS